MLLTVGEFRERVDTGLPLLVQELQTLTGRTGQEEADAWSASLPRLAGLLEAPQLSGLHMYFSGAGYLALEYQLPAASSWCDVVLLGRDGEQSQAVVIELKHWQTWGDRPGPYEGLMERHGSIVLHPADQVRGYVGYLRRFHSTVHDHGAEVWGCVLFTHDRFIDSYREPPNDRLTTEYPCYTVFAGAGREALPRFLTDHVTAPNEAFSAAFVRGRYQQDRSFMRQIGAQILTPESTPFELLDHQRRAFAMVRARLDEAMFSGTGLRKQVILIEGPPGSGKSVLAAKIWAALVSDDRLPEGSVVLTTTSTSQTSNWTRLFQRAAGTPDAGGIVKKAASYVPVSTQEVGRLRKQHGRTFVKDPEHWRENVHLLRNLGVPFQDGARDDRYLVSIVDEAHALINPEHTEGRGQFGFAPSLGPLAWHIIRASKVSVFLLDSEQGFRDRENTSPRDIRAWARELGAEVRDPISLEGAQFRCAGSKEYVEWVELLLRGEDPERARALARVWQRVLDFRILETPAELEHVLRERIAEGRSARLLASYAREWRTKGSERPHDLPASMQDFHIPYSEHGRQRYWSRIWNYIPRNGSDYTWFIQAPEGSPMYEDPLCEVGCPYAVRGFDFDYVGVLWLGDLRYRNEEWEVDTREVYETGLNRTLRAARDGPATGAARRQLRDALAQAYRILLTRGIYGSYLWFEDGKTREYVESCLDSSRALWR